MKIRVSILAKVVLWLFGNLAIVVAVSLALFSTPIGGGIGKAIKRQASERLRSVTRVLGSELSSSSESEWASVLERYRENYGVDFALCDEAGDVVAGSPPALPDAVHEGIVDLMETEETRRDRSMSREGLDERGPPPGPPPDRDGDRFDRHEGPHGPGRGFPPEPPPIPGAEQKLSLVTTNPKTYWTGHEIAVATKPFRPPDHYVVLIRSDSPTANGLLFDASPWIALATILGLVSLLWWFPLVWHMTRPLKRMTEATGRIASGRFETRVDENRGDEIGRLGAAINHMATQLDGYVRGQKRFLGDIAHELGSPIARVQMALGILESRVDEGDRAQVDDTIDEVRHLSDLVGELLSFTRAQTAPENIRRDIVELRSAVERAVTREAPGRSVQITIDPATRVRGAEDLIVRAVANLVRNAIVHAGECTTEIEARALSGRVALLVRDHGPGVPEADLPRLFEPFYRPDTSRTRETGGAGLGLAIVQTCVHACGGTVRAQNVSPSGFEVSIELDEV